MARLLLFAICCTAYAHVVSMSSGELHVNGRTATYELRIPVYELTHVTHPETALLDQVKFEGARRTSSNCQEQDGTYICRADYEFDRPVPDKIEVECTLFQVTVPNHVHLLYAVQGPNSDQEVFDQSFRQAEVRFHPPSRAEVIAKAAAAGIARLFKSVSGLMFLVVLVLAARNTREMGILTIAFLAGEWLALPISPRIPMSFSPEFLEAVLALTVAYLAAEIVFLPDSQARWAVVPVLGIAHGLPFSAFPSSYLTAASITQAIVLAVLWIAARKMPAAWRRPVAGVMLVAGIGWFVRMLL
ncbi:MAG: HupE/UreJ family protein [Acidobacteriia bacterium]|nr:HupE/UreJ family protein [Terriglobia bacterium]